MKEVTRDEFKGMLAAGRKFCWAALYERQDFYLLLGPQEKRPVRDITDEPHLWHRRIGK